MYLAEEPQVRYLEQYGFLVVIIVVDFRRRLCYITRNSLQYSKTV